ncbi:DUF2207 family protein, partial [Salmonella enterica]|uniref:DUF2207 family protein n=1 Tax=Salmonella enterica TaxID=28901 RepID=UPI00190ABC92
DSQRAIAARLFRKGDTVELASGNASEIGSARGEQIKALMRHYKPHYFVGNGGTLLTGLLFSVAYGIAALAIARGDGIAAIAVLLGLSVAAHAVFTWLMGTPTAEGRRLLDRVEGLRLYLGVAERDELKA